MESVRVAVRVRPFNQREKDRNAKCIIQMPVDRPGLCGILNPADGKTHEFTFDFAYWSHDHSREFSSQDVVYQDMGADILGKCFEGYNFTLFAYGQTGAGKSYSMMGAGDIRGSEAGIIPRVCAGLFEKIAELKAGGSETQYKVEAGFLEIYNEKIRDLLDTHADPKSAGLKIRESKQLGIYVEGQKKMPVGCYEDVERVLETGNMNRTVGATAMNAVSSRSHSVFTITFTQTKVMKETLSASDTISKLNLVDLAGSERANSTGATGDRLKEGCAINKSLSALGNVISALAKNSQGGKKKELVPYRDSTLTRLLQESLGGNSITTMIAALSPADINYDETLSTLRYADRAKQIKNAAKRNENPNERIIRELKEEIERLKAALGGDPAALAAAAASGSGEGNKPGSAAMSEDMRRELEAKEKMIESMNMSWEEKLQKAVEEERARAAQMALLGIGRADEPHVLNLNEDPILSETLLYAVKTEGETTIGAGSEDEEGEKPDITVRGQGMLPIHCRIIWKGCVHEGTQENPPHNEFELTITSGAEVYHNGEKVEIPGSGNEAKSDGEQQETKASQYPVKLLHGDRILLGQTNWFRFVDPVTATWFAEDAKSRGTIYKPPLLDYDFAQRELSRKKLGINDEEENLERAITDKMRKLEEDYQRQLEERLKEYDSEKEKEMERRRLEIEKEAEMKKLQEEQAKVEYKVQRKKVLESTITDLVTPITRANYYSEQLGKNVVFDLNLLTMLDPDDPDGGSMSKVEVKMSHLITGKISFYTPEEFMELYYRMFDICEDLLTVENEEERMKLAELPENQAPFEDTRKNVSKMVGTATLVLTPLWYNFDTETKLALIGADSAVKCGDVSIFYAPEPPNDMSGAQKALEEFEEGSLFEVGKKSTVTVEIQQVFGLPRDLRKNCFVQYRWFNEKEMRKSPVSEGLNSNPMIRWTQHLIVDPVTEDFQKYVQERMLIIEVWASPSPETHEDIVRKAKASSSDKHSESRSQDAENDDIVVPKPSSVTGESLESLMKMQEDSDNSLEQDAEDSEGRELVGGMAARSEPSKAARASGTQNSTDSDTRKPRGENASQDSPANAGANIPADAPQNKGCCCVM